MIQPGSMLKNMNFNNAGGYYEIAKIFTDRKNIEKKHAQSLYTFDCIDRYVSAISGILSKEAPLNFIEYLYCYGWA